MVGLVGVGGVGRVGQRPLRELKPTIFLSGTLSQRLWNGSGWDAKEKLYWEPDNLNGLGQVGYCSIVVGGLGHFWVVGMGGSLPQLLKRC